MNTHKIKGTLGLVVRVSDVSGRDKRGDRFISPVEQVRIGTGYAQSDGWDVEVVEPMDLNVSHTTPLDDRLAMGLALRRVESGEWIDRAMHEEPEAVSRHEQDVLSARARRDWADRRRLAWREARTTIDGALDEFAAVVGSDRALQHAVRGVRRSADAVSRRVAAS